MRKLISFLALFCFATSACLAAEYSVRNQTSAVVFKIKRGIVIMHGRVFSSEITFEYDSEDPKSWRIEAEIPIRGIQVAERGLDRQMKEDGNLFKVIEYPIIYFDSREVVSADKENAVIRGILSVNGIEKEVDLNVHVNGENSFGSNDSKRKVIGIHAEATIKRSDFDILWPIERSKKKYRNGARFADEVQFEFDLLGMEIR